MSNNNPTATATATVGLPVASLAVFVMLIMKVGNIAGFGAVSWWWVFSPWLIGIGLLVGIVGLLALVAGIALGIAEIMDRHDRRKRRKEKLKSLKR